MPRILIVEDDTELARDLGARLEREGFTVTLVHDGDAALAADLADLDVVLLDLGLPGTYGLDVLRRYRETSEVPVLLVTARDHTSDKVRGLALGADDYVTKPFLPDELLARIRARMRRPSMKKASEASVLRAGDLEIDVGAQRVALAGRDVELTRAELAILELLARRAGRAVSRAELAEHALGDDRGGGERALDVHVSRVRKKLGAEGSRIVTVWGIGYRLESQR